MSAPKKSIRDFFSPVPSTARPAVKNAPPQRASPATNNAQTSQPINRDPLKEPPGPSALPTTVDVSLPVSSPSAAVTAPHSSMTSEAPPLIPSQTSAASAASRRIVSNGEQVVLNSDSDSDSLPDLDWGEPKTSFKTTVTSTRLKRTSEHENDVLRKPEKKGRTNKQSFTKLVERAVQNIEMEQRIKEHKADLEKALEEPTKGNIMINEDMLGQIVQADDDDPEKAHRLLLAMQRTNATQVESVFCFFGDTSDSIRVQPKFPRHCLPKQQWARNFADSYARDQAFLTGFAYQIFRLQQLPEELASWMLDQVCLGQSEALNTKYLDILEIHHEYILTLMDKERLNTLFKAIGANVKYLRPENEVSPSLEALSAKRPTLPLSLKSVMRLLHRVATWLQMETRCHALYILCHVCLDDNVLADANLLKTIQDTIEALIYSISADKTTIDDARDSPMSEFPQLLINLQLRDIISKLASRIKHPVLQRNLVYALPARSPLTAYFQRHLSLCFLLHPMESDISVADPKIPLLIHEHLDKSPNFRISKTTDYGHLAASLTLLDIAIGPGLLSVPYLPSLESTSSKASSLPAPTTFRSSPEVKNFNTEIDGLVQHIKLLGNSIVEAGAVVDFTILNAKDNVERLCSRLEHSVRIGGKKPHNVFGSVEEERQSKVSQFLKKLSNPAVTAQSGIFEEDEAGENDIQTLRNPSIVVEEH